MGGLEVLFSDLRVVSGLHSLVASLLPLGRADLAVLVGVLEGLDESEDFLDVAADGKIVEAHVSEVALGVNDEGGAESDALVAAMLNQAVVGLGDILGDVGQQGEIKVNETALLKRSLAPLHVRELGVDGAADEDGVVGVELAGELIESQNFSGADKGEVQRVEEENDVLASVGVGVNGDELALEVSVALESGGGLADDEGLVLVGLHL